jgi:hypothetical protein
VTSALSRPSPGRGSAPWPGNYIIVLFGATVNLARRKLLPGLFHLGQVASTGAICPFTAVMTPAPRPHHLVRRPPPWLKNAPQPSQQAVTTTVAVMTEAWTAPKAECTDPGLILGEHQVLEAWLDFHRDTLLRKCAGLTAGQLKERAVPPSRLSLLGLVRHMTEVEALVVPHARGEQRHALPVRPAPDRPGL